MITQEYYADYDEDSVSWCVFSTESSKAIYCYTSEEEAEETVEELNN